LVTWRGEGGRRWRWRRGRRRRRRKEVSYPGRKEDRKEPSVRLTSATALLLYPVTNALLASIPPPHRG
jgi:hypothetical protein